VQTLFIDDIDGSAAEGTVRFGLDAPEYEVDLNTERAQQPRTRGSWLSSSDYGRDKPGALWLALIERALTSV
jgi:hypothetical protein